MKPRLLLVLVALLTIAVPGKASADAIGILQQISPIPTNYALGAGFDFVPFYLSGLGDVTANIFAVDITLPPDPVPNTSTSGCEAADFAGFPVGSIALLQRGTCMFELKVANAAAAGAVGVLVFNEGQPGRTDAINGTLGSLALVPAAFTSFGVGVELYNLWLTGGVVVRLAVTDNTQPAAVPEPATLTLLGLGLGAAALRRRRTR